MIGKYYVYFPFWFTVLLCSALLRKKKDAFSLSFFCFNWYSFHTRLIATTRYEAPTRRQRWKAYNKADQKEPKTRCAYDSRLEGIKIVGLRKAFYSIGIPCWQRISEFSCTRKETEDMTCWSSNISEWWQKTQASHQNKEWSFHEKCNEFSQFIWASVKVTTSENTLTGYILMMS